MGEQIIINDDCLKIMNGMESESIDIVVTSCPYNIGVKYNSYDDNKTQLEYLDWMYNVCKQIKRLLKPEGSFFLNIGGTNTNPSIPWEVYFYIKDLFCLQNHIVWVKSIDINNDNSFGHFKPINSPRFLNNNHESIFHLTKTGNVKIDRLAVGSPYKHKSNISRWKNKKVDLRCSGNVWFIPYDTVMKKKLHPAGFPLDLPMRCIKLHGYNSETQVLDPFVGAGTTLKACQILNIKGTGIDSDEKYCEMTKNYIKM